MAKGVSSLSAKQHRILYLTGCLNFSQTASEKGPFVALLASASYDEQYELKQVLKTNRLSYDPFLRIFVLIQITDNFSLLLV